MRRSRVRNRDTIRFDIHDRVNWAVEHSQLDLDKAAGTVTLVIRLDTQVCSVMDYFEIFLARMLLCRKAAEYFHKRSIPILQLDEKLTSTVEYFGMKQAFQLSQWLCQSYLAGKFDVMYIVYTNFVSALSQQPGSLCMLPISKVATATVSKREILYEPSAVAVFERIVPQYIAGLLYGAVTESFASEQAARRTAMESATDNADEMIEQLGLRYNQARQGAITQEITEIAAGAQAAQ